MEKADGEVHPEDGLPVTNQSLQHLEKARKSQGVIDDHGCKLPGDHESKNRERLDPMFSQFVSDGVG